MSATLKLKVGMEVFLGDEQWVVIDIKDLETVICRNTSGRQVATLPILGLSKSPQSRFKEKSTQLVPDLATIPHPQWQLASARLEAIKKLAEKGRHAKTKEDVQKVAMELGRSYQTVYRWLANFEKVGTISSFLRKERNDKGQGKLDSEVEEIIRDAIKKNLLKREHGTVKDVYRDVKKACDEKGLRYPGLTTLRDRFQSIPEKERVRSQQGARAAKERFTPLRGAFPGADYPLSVLQIDHTPIDVIIVDEVYRKPIGRPTLTIAIDVCTRVIMGFNLWLEAPSAASVGMCLVNALLPKEKWLKQRGIDASWPCYGRPRKIHTDNAKEFRGSVLGRACQSYGIDLEQRPRGAPNYGGHVERSFRTFMRKAHTIKGTTFSNTKSKFDYDSAGKASMSLKEFEVWFAIYVTTVYHNDFHHGVKTTPLQAFRNGLLGKDGKPGIGLPEKFVDEERLRLDFLPFVERTVQEYGVLIDHVYYNDDALRPYIRERDPANPKAAKRHIFRRDPDDISVVYFWEPAARAYKSIPYAHRGRPPASLWEVRAAAREQFANGRKAVDENSIFEGIGLMREIEQAAAARTISARRNEERRRNAEGRRETKAASKVEAALQIKPHPQRPPEEKITQDDNSEVIVPFDDIDMRR